MTFPTFFSAVRSIRMRDPLTAFLGSAEDGILEYTYADAVRLAGHSCPTVAGTWLMLAKGLNALYGDKTPERGAISVSFPGRREEGVTGVMAAVASLVTGATDQDGFKGLGGDFDRRFLLRFAAGGTGEMRLERRDGKGAVEVFYSARGIPSDPQMGPLMQAALAGQASDDEIRRFGELWQDRVRRILIDHGDDRDVVRVAAAAP